MTNTQTKPDPLFELRAAAGRLAEYRARGIASVVYKMWLADWQQRASRNQIVAASGLARQSGYDALTLGDEARAAYDALHGAGVPTDEESHAEVEISIRPLSTRRMIVSLDAVAGRDGDTDRDMLWRRAMSALRGAGWVPEDVEQPEDPDVGYWPQATIGRRTA